jgi:hypothetical protein
LCLDSSSARLLFRSRARTAGNKGTSKILPSFLPSFLHSSLGLFVVYEPYPHSYTIKYTIMCTWIRENTN